MAIALANILGFQICENFDLPFLATDLSGFWKRWHISLSSWLTEYVYFSVGGSRKGEIRTCINLMITMIVSGLWHGFSFGFFIWGMMNGIVLVIQRIYRNVMRTKRQKSNNMIWRFLAPCINSVLVVVLFIPFALGEKNKIYIVFERIITMAQGAKYYYAYGIVFLPILIFIHFIGAMKTNSHCPLRYLDLTKFRGKVLFLLLVFLTILFAYFGNTAFIYEKF